MIGETNYAYDAADRLTSVTDAAGNVTTIRYDGLGRKVGMLDPDMGAWSYGYNALGQLTSQTDAKGQTMSFSFDPLGRMMNKSAAGAGVLATYLYDQGLNGIGRRTAMTDTNGSSAWAYDARGRTITATKQINPNPIAYATVFGYDAANRPIRMTYPGGDVVTNTYDAAGQPFSLFAGGSALVQSAFYNTLGAPTRVTYGNGLDKVNNYHGLEFKLANPLQLYGRLRNTCVITAGQACDDGLMSALLNTVYTYDPVGNVLAVRDNVLNSRMSASYDALDRLVSVTTAPYTSTLAERAPMAETYSYDKIGNMTSKAGIVITSGVAKSGVVVRLGFEAYTVFSPTNPGASFQVNPTSTGGAWTFGGSAGVSENSTFLTSGNPPAPEGTRVAFLQGAGAAITAIVANVIVGQTYRVSFMLARRVNYGAGAVPVTLRVGGQEMGVYTPTSGIYERRVSVPFTASATSLTVAFWATPPDGQDRTSFIDDVMVTSAGPHAALAMSNGNSFDYDANGNMTVRREMSGTQLFVYTQTWTVDNRLASIAKASVAGTVLAVTSYAYDGDGTRVRKADPDGTTLYVGATEAIIGAPGTAAIEYYDDTQAGTFTFLSYTKTVVSATAGISYAWGTAVPLAGMGDAPLRLARFAGRSGQAWALRWNQWVSVTQAGLYTVTVIADDGVGLSIAGVSVIYSLAIRDTGPLTAGIGVNLTPGNLYQLQVSYLNYTNANGASFRLRWTRPDGVTEDIPASALRARSRRDYYSFGGAAVAMKEGVAKDARVLTCLHGDHLGSASLATNASGAKVSEQRFRPYGELRWSSAAAMPTEFGFTGQRTESSSYVGSLMDYVARSYSPALGRFVSADTIVPGAGKGPALNRYSYALNSPLQYSDPSGHSVCQTQEDCSEQRSTPNGNMPNPFPISFQGDWDDGAKATVILLAYRFETRFREADRAAKFAMRNDPDSRGNCSLCGMTRPGVIFAATIGTWTLIRSKESQAYGAEVFPDNTIEYYPIAFGNFTYHHPAHEFFHAFNFRAGNAPSQHLKDSTITVNGKAIAGGGLRTDLGYRFGPGGSQLPYQQHGTAFKDYGDPCCGEDFADMAMNWLERTFANDAYGDARNVWVNGNMAHWIALTVEAKKMTSQTHRQCDLSGFVVYLAMLALLAGCGTEMERGRTQSPKPTAVASVLANSSPPAPPAAGPLTPVAVAATATVSPPAAPTVTRSFYPESDPVHIRSVRSAIAAAPDCRLPCWWGLWLGGTEHDVVSKLNERGITFGALRLKDGTIDQINVSEMEGGGQSTGGRIDILFDFSSSGRLRLMSMVFEASRPYARQFWKTDNLSSVLWRAEPVVAVRVIRPIPVFKVDQLPVELNVKYSTVNGSTASLTIASTVETLAYSKARPGERCANFDFEMPERANIWIQADTFGSTPEPTPSPSQYEVFTIAVADFVDAMRDSKPKLCW